MAFMEWNESYSVGVAVLDAEHRELVATVNELYEAMMKGKGKEVMGKTLERMMDYCKFHFAHEEELFAKTNYPDTAAHKVEHENHAKLVLELKTKFKTNLGNAVSIELLNTLRNWLIDHFLGTDQKYTAHFNAHGIE